jgi:uncharacterized protein (DUF433 family)
LWPKGAEGVKAGFAVAAADLGTHRLMHSIRVFGYDGGKGRALGMKERISVNPAVHFGKPCVAGTRIPVQNVLELVREELAFTEVIRDYYPELAPEDIRACIQYAIDIVAAEDIHLATVP